MTGSKVCIDANALNAIGTFSIQYYGDTAVPLTVKSLVGGIFPMLGAGGGNPSVLHRYGVAVDFACGMFETTVPDSCLRILNLCARKTRQLNLPSLYISVYAENYGCGSATSYFDSVHCTLGAVDARAFVVPTFQSENDGF